MNTVWIVDDDRSIRWVLEKALSREEIHYESFTSATDAIAALEDAQTPPSVLISDIRMPGRSGLDLLQRMKSLHPSVPVIIMTAYSDLDSAVSAFQGGAFEYLPKPFDVDQAIALVQRALGSRARTRPVRNLTPPSLPRSSARRRPCRKSSAPSAVWPSRTPRC
jgi:two-component system, NtrC family, nitrogen regulation response regulator GlnG